MDKRHDMYEKHGRLAYFSYLRGEIPLQEVWWCWMYEVCNMRGMKAERPAYFSYLRGEMHERYEKYER